MAEFAMISIRKGTQNDLQKVLVLIKELADYEKAPQEVTITLEELLEDGFGSDPIFGLFVAEIDSVLVGMALYYEKYSTWKGRSLFLEDIIVTETKRGLGVGHLLFDAVIEVARARNSARMEWQVLNWNEPAIKFYEKYNAELDGEWINGKLTRAQIQSHFQR